MLVAGGATDVTTYFAMRLTADGKAATGLTPADFDLQYTRSGEAAVTKVDATLNGNGVGGDHSDSTVIEVDATSSPGLYRIDWVDAAFAAGVREVILSAKVATAFTEHLRVGLDGPAALVNAEVVDVMRVDTIAELAQAIPAATPTFATGLMLMYMGIRNKLDIDRTAATKEIHNDAGTQIAVKTTSDDGTTYSEAKMAAGS